MAAQPEPMHGTQGWLRAVPWLLALAGLGIPLVGTGFQVWPIVLVWLGVLALGWLVGGALLPRRSQRIAAAILLLPVLVLLAFEGGWWLIPADLAWLAIEVADDEARPDPDAPRRLTGEAARLAPDAGSPPHRGSISRRWPLRSSLDMTSDGRTLVWSWVMVWPAVGSVVHGGRGHLDAYLGLRV